MPAEAYKACTRCGEDKPLDQFSVRTNGKPQSYCKPCVAANTAEWRKKNPDRWPEANRRWRRENPERKIATDRAWAERNREKVRASVRRWNAANPEAVRRVQRRWRERHRDLLRNRSRLGKNPHSHEYASVLRQDPCCYCGGPCESIDHIEPVIEGGSHEWTNLTASCGSCNSSKNARPLLTFLLTNPIT